MAGGKAKAEHVFHEPTQLRGLPTLRNEDPRIVSGDDSKIPMEPVNRVKEGGRAPRRGEGCSDLPRYNPALPHTGHDDPSAHIVEDLYCLGEAIVQTISQPPDG
jgi:hypothetical protein